MRTNHHRLSLAIIGLTAALIGTSAITAAPVEAKLTKEFKPEVTRRYGPGITYQRGVAYTNGTRRQSVRVVTVDPRNPQAMVRSLLSNRKVLWRQRVTSTGRSYTRPGFTVVAATNGDMSRHGREDAYAAPTGSHVAGGELMVAQACANPTLGVDADGTARMGNVRTRIQLWPPGKKNPRWVHRVNTHRDDNHAVLFTSRFGPSTKTTGGREVVMKMSDRKLRINDRQRMTVTKVRRTGNTKLRRGYAVLSTKLGTPHNDWITKLRVGDKVTIKTDFVGSQPDCGSQVPQPGWGKVTETQTGTHFSVRRGKNTASTAAGNYVAAVHPKTGLGVTADGKILMVTVDGRQGSYSRGVSMDEMAQLMKGLGAVNAINLDGGGSTSMSRRRNGLLRVDNRPSDGRERRMTQTFAAIRLPAPSTPDVD